MFASRQQKAQPPAERSKKHRQTFTNQDAINFMRRYNTETEPAKESDEDRKCCFTDNYLIFSLQEKMPQLTSIYLDLEDNLLDYCKTVNFNRQTVLPSVLEELQELDGDACQAVVNQAPQEKLDESMFMNDALENYDLHIRRYSVVGNDSSFKAYTRNNSYFQGRDSQAPVSLEDQVLSATLKDAGHHKEDSEDGRQQYRVVHSDLVFVVTHSGQSKGKGTAERSLNDFRQLVAALKKLYPGCYVPQLPKQQASIDMPQSIFDFRKTPLECQQVTLFLGKLKRTAYLMESDTAQMFLDPRIAQPQYESKLAIHVRTQTAAQADTLNRFKQAFNLLSGREVNQQTFEQIDKFKAFLAEAQKMLLKLKTCGEKAMTNKVESDNSRTKLMQSLGQLEDFLAQDLNQSHYKLRAQQKVLDKYQEVAVNDSHWKSFETFDDFAIDQLADCQAYFDVFADQDRLKLKCQQLKQTLDARTETYTQIDKRQGGGQRARQAKQETDQAEVAFLEANLTHNISILNLAYQSIPQFRAEKRQQFAAVLKAVSQNRVVQQNELHGYFKFVLNFY